MRALEKASNILGQKVWYWHLVQKRVVGRLVSDLVGNDKMEQSKADPVIRALPHRHPMLSFKV